VSSPPHGGPNSCHLYNLPYAGLMTSKPWTDSFTSEGLIIPLPLTPTQSRNIPNLPPPPHCKSRHAIRPGKVHARGGYCKICKNISSSDKTFETVQVLTDALLLQREAGKRAGESIGLQSAKASGSKTRRICGKVCWNPKKGRQFYNLHTQAQDA
jgi:hypothetical protein